MILQDISLAEAEKTKHLHRGLHGLPQVPVSPGWAPGDGMKEFYAFLMRADLFPTLS
jgi:hypothetical protein